MGITNAEVAQRFREVADLLEIEGANPFRIRAYRNAARTIEEWPAPVEVLAREGPEALDAIPGVGADLAGKIVELARTGRLAALGRLEREVPPGVAVLMRVPGIGPRRARLLHERLGVRSLAQLERAATTGRVRGLPGFGPRTEAQVLEALRAHRTTEHRVLRPVAAQHGERLLEALQALPAVRACELAGSFRRGRDTVGDLDFVASTDDGAAVIDAFCRLPEVSAVLARGTTRATIRLRAGLQADLRTLAPASYGAALHYFTGSKAHNIALRRLAQRRGLKLNEYGLFQGTRRLAGRTEAEVYRALGLPFIPPELREDQGELEAARGRTLPHLVTLEDIRGDLQAHTTDSDGRDTLDAMARAAEARGYDYLAVTDHTTAVRVAGGLDRAGFRAQARRIERLNARLTKLTVLAGAEIDIAADGTLDLDDDTLARLDVVLVTFHSKFTLPARDQTRRLVRAVSHPRTMILGHPTGRLIGRRAPAAYDFATVCRACADHGVALEIDAQPERMDLEDARAREALAAGVRLVISSDAHSAAELDFMRWGVTQARRAWAEPAQVLNTLGLARLTKALAR